MMPSLPDPHAAALPKVVAGLGCRRGCAQGELLDLLIHSLRQYGLTLNDLAGLASIEHKRDEAGLLALAAELDLPLSLFSAEQLAPYLSAPVHNPLALAVAEPGALALAAQLGQTPRLLGGKTRSASATCALATFDREPSA